MGKKLIIIFQKCLFISLISMLIFQNVEADEIFDKGVASERVERERGHLVGRVEGSVVAGVDAEDGVVVVSGVVGGAGTG